MKEKTKEIVKLLTIPLVLLGIYVSMVFLWKIFSFPSPEELVEVTASYFEKYGLWIVFISALIEGFLLLGQYFPGSFIIFLGVISAGNNVVRAAQTVGVVSIAFFIAYSLNYLIGRYGWYKLFVKLGLKRPLDNAQERLTKHGLRAILFCYWEPNLSSIIATAAGVLHLSISKFLLYSVLGILVWNTFWGILVFNLGKTALAFTGIKYILIIFVIWVSIILIAYFIRKRKNTKV